MHASKKLSIRENIIWNSCGNLIYWGCSWFTTILIVRLGSYELAGILSLAMSIDSTIYCISAYGVYNFQVSDVKNEYTPDNYLSMRIVSAILGILICLITCFVQQYNPYQSGCILIYMLYKTVECFINVIQAEEQKANRMDLIGKSYMIRGIGTLICFVIGLIITNNLFITLCMMCLFSLLVFILFDLSKVHQVLGRKYQIGMGRVTSLMVTCLPMALYWLFNTLTPTVPKMCIENILGTQELGVYASISSPLLIITMAANFILTPLISPLSNFYFLDRGKALSKAILKILFLMVASGIICLIGARLCLRIGLRILYGETILQYLNIAYYIVGVVILSAVISFLNILYTIFRKLWLLVFINGGVAGAAILLCNVFITEYGLQGANYALGIVYAAQIMLMLLIFLNIYTKWIRTSGGK